MQICWSIYRGNLKKWIPPRPRLKRFVYCIHIHIYVYAWGARCDSRGVRKTCLCVLENSGVRRIVRFCSLVWDGLALLFFAWTVAFLSDCGCHRFDKRVSWTFLFASSIEINIFENILRFCRPGCDWFRLLFSAAISAFLVRLWSPPFWQEGCYENQYVRHRWDSCISSYRVFLLSALSRPSKYH